MRLYWEFYAYFFSLTFFAQWFNTKQQYDPVITFGAVKAPLVQAPPLPNLKQIHTQTTTEPNLWCIHQPVKHAQYGIGTIKNTEVKSDDTYITVSFKTGIKKISARFLQRL